MSTDWKALWSKAMKVEDHGKWGYGVGKLMESELNDHGAGSEEVASTKVTTDLKSVLSDLEHFELLCANMRQTDVKEDAEKSKDERTAMIEKLCPPMEKSIADLQTIKKTLVDRLGRIDTATAFEHLNADDMPQDASDGSSLGEIRQKLRVRIDVFNAVFNRSGAAKGGEVPGQSALGVSAFEKLREFQAACHDDAAMFEALLGGQVASADDADAREANKAVLAADLDASLSEAEDAYLQLIHAGKRFLDAEAASHKGVERPSLFESTRSMLALEGLRIVETGDHKTMHGAGQVLELLERRLESLRSIPVLRREADVHLKATKKADKTVKKLFIKVRAHANADSECRQPAADSC